MRPSPRRLPLLPLLASTFLFLGTPGSLLAQIPAPTLRPIPTSASTLDTHLPLPANPVLRSLFLVGDSAISAGPGGTSAGGQGWGDPLATFFDRAEINVVNRAITSSSARAYVAEGFWADTLALVKSGDVVLIQFTGNDADPATTVEGSLPGVNDDFRDLANPTTYQPELVHTFGWYLRQIAVDTLAHGATPILCSPVPHNQWQNGHLRQPPETVAGWARAIAVQQRVPFVDLNTILTRRFDALGQAAVAPLFADDQTHSSAAGARLNAEAVIAGLKALQPDPLSSFFSPAAANIQPAELPLLPAPAPPTSLQLPTVPTASQP